MRNQGSLLVSGRKVAPIRPLVLALKGLISGIGINQKNGYPPIMTNSRYRLVFSGKLRQGFIHEEVQRALAQLLKIPLDQAGHLIQGNRFRINKSLEKSKAERLLEKIRERGAECSIEPSAPTSLPTSKSGHEHAAEAVDRKVRNPASASIKADTDPAAPAGRETVDERTRPLATVRPEPAAGDEEDIVLATPGVRRAAYKSDDDSDNVGILLERSTLVRNAEAGGGDKRRHLILLGGLLLVGAAAAWLLLPMGEEPPAPSVTRAPTVPVDPQRAETNRRLEQLSRSIRVWMIQYGSGFDPAQVTLDRLQQDLEIGPRDMLDGWGTGLRFEPEGEKYRVISAGPDKSFGTADDLQRETAIK